MSDEFPAIVTRIGGKLRRLVLEKQWKRAISSGDLERDTMIRYEESSEVSRECPARECTELAVIFEQLLGPDPKLAPPPAEPAPAPANVRVTIQPAPPDDAAAMAPTPLFPPVERPAGAPSFGKREWAASRLTPTRRDPERGDATTRPKVHPSFVALTRFSEFEGRSGRAEFWLFMRLVLSVVLSLLVLGGLLHAPALISLAVLIYLPALLPSLSVTVRRLHDLNLSGWWLLGWIVGAAALGPGAGVLLSIIGVIVLAMPGKPEANRFGSGPLPM